MAKPSSPRRLLRALTLHLLPRSDAVLYLVGLLSLLSLLGHILSPRSAHASPLHHFEGFDADAEDEPDELPLYDLPVTPSPSPPHTALTPESHHGPPNPPPAKPSPLHDWDEDEFEGFPSPASDPLPELSPAEADPIPQPLPPEPKSFPGSYTIEIACLSFLLTFAINYFSGKLQNEKIALAWAEKFATKDGVFVKNFSLLGTGDGNDDAPLLLKEGSDVFKFYASGRRFCQGMLATMEMKARHDLIARIFDLVMPKPDSITFEVVMNDDAMDHIVFALARKKLAKAMHKEEVDLQKYAVLVTAPPSGKKWVPEELAVVTESKEVAGDMLTDAVLDQVFGEKSFEKFGKGFISMHFSDQESGTRKKVLMFKFVLPDIDNMADMTRLVALVPYYIDLVGRYKLSPQARSKTETARAKAAQEVYRELQNARQEALQKKKAEKRKLLEEAEAKLSAEAIRKKEEKERARQMKKSMPKVKMLR